MKVSNLKILALCLFLTEIYVEDDAYAHGIGTHSNITQAAVGYVSKLDQRLACSKRLNDLLQIGTVAEDDTPRFMFHFYPRLNDGKTISTCSSRDWAFGNVLCNQEGGAPLFSASALTNQHGWKQVIQSTKINKGLTELGYVLHLLEDLTSPAHTRNDAHPPGLDGDPVEAITRTPITPELSDGLLFFSKPEQSFDALQKYTSTNFYSSDTVFVGEGPSSARVDDDYFYDVSNHRIAYKGLAYKLSGFSEDSRDRTQATINATIANEQFTRLGPVAVRYAASLIKHYVDTTSLKVNDCFIDFEEFSGDSYFTGASAPLLTENATVSGGQILSNTTFLPVNRTTVYGTAYFCNGCLPTITIDFTDPVKDLKLLLMNGQTFTVTYTLKNNLGDLVTISLAANSQNGAALVGLPSGGIIKATITGDTSSWDFLIDNIEYKIES